MREYIVQYITMFLCESVFDCTWDSKRPQTLETSHPQKQRDSPEIHPHKH